MSANGYSSTKRRKGYAYDSLRPLNCLVFVLPMLIIYQVGSAYYGSRLLAPRDLYKILKYFGGTAAYLPAMFIIVSLLIQHIAHKDKWEIQPKVLAGMVGESIIWMLPLVAMAHVSERLATNMQAAAGSAGNWQQEVLMSFGAGIYEEFLFRMLFISMAILIFSDIFGLRKDIVTISAVLAGGVLFGLYHFSGEELSNWPHLPWAPLIFLSAAGVFLGSIFVMRGYAICVGAHILYNIYVYYGLKVHL